MYVFPAPAGVILSVVLTLTHTVSFPRTCGGDPAMQTDAIKMESFSPHLRG